MDAKTKPGLPVLPLTSNVLLFAALALLVGVHEGWLRSLHVASVNMSPTLSLDDRVLVRGYGIKPVAGEVVVYRTPFGTGDVQVGRIVGVPGSKVEMDENGLRVDDRFVEVAAGDCAPKSPLTANALEACELPPPAAPDAHGALVGWEEVGEHRYATRKAGALTGLFFPSRSVPEGHVFVLNDNRVDERDSRIYGAIPLSAVVGVATFVYYAKDEAGIRWDRMNRRVS